MKFLTFVAAAMLAACSCSIAAATSTRFSFTYTCAHEHTSRSVAESVVRAGYRSTCEEEGGEVADVDF